MVRFGSTAKRGLSSPDLYISGTEMGGGRLLEEPGKPTVNCSLRSAKNCYNLSKVEVRFLYLWRMSSIIITVIDMHYLRTCNREVKA